MKSSQKGTEIWTAAQYRDYLTKGGKPSTPVAKKKKPTGAKQKWEIEMVLKMLGFELPDLDMWMESDKDNTKIYTREYRFHVKRMFRFDWAIPALKIAIEYEGVGGGGKSRHTTFSGYSTDAEKYNLAASDGWTVLRYTVKNYRNLTDDLNKILELKQL